MAADYSSDARRAARLMSFILDEAEHMDFADRMSALRYAQEIAVAHEDLSNMLHDAARLLDSLPDSEEQEPIDVTQAPVRG